MLSSYTPSNYNGSSELLQMNSDHTEPPCAPFRFEALPGGRKSTSNVSLGFT